jgi:type II secretory pathway component PulC
VAARRQNILPLRTQTHPLILLADVSALLFYVSIITAGCAGNQTSQQHSTPSPPVVQPAKKQAAAPNPSPQPQPPSALHEPSATTTAETKLTPPPQGTIRRKELNAFLAKGAQHFIQLVRVRPTFKQGVFWGWRLMAYRGPGPLVPGDIVRNINGQAIERPEQFMAVWNRLTHQREIAIALFRNGQEITLRFSIMD